MSKKKVFVIGLDDFNLEKLQRLPQADECEFLPALDYSDIRGAKTYDIIALIDKAVEKINAAGGKPDAIVTYYDFPGTTMLPILAERFNLPGPTLESLMKCEHKFWSRMEQQKVIADHIPQFFAFDPFEENPLENVPLIPPFWIKPVKSFRSFLAYRINDIEAFNQALPEIREKIGYYNEPFLKLFEVYPLPYEIGQMKETFIAESVLAGTMCTVEGYVFNGQVVVYGVVDSVREHDRSSFARYEYPSTLPQEVQFRMADVARRAISGIGLDNTPFNIEFFWNQTYDQVMLLEINPRISQAHTDIFEKVHGISHHSIMLDIALGRKPRIMEYNGDFHKAANFMVRIFERGKIKRVPSRQEISKIARQMPGTIVKLHVEPGTDLDELTGQDSYSYELANIYIGARDQLELLGKYHRCLEQLTFDIEREDRYISISQTS